MAKSDYRPFRPAKRPGGRPRGAPQFRVLVHHRMHERWSELVQRVGLESAQQFYDHVAHTPDRPSDINRTTILRGRASRPSDPGFSRTVHYEISGAARIDYQYHPQFLGRQGDTHAVVRILAITYTSH